MSKLNENYICLTPEYLKIMIKEFMGRQIISELVSQNIDLSDLKDSPEAMWNFVDPIVKENQKSTDFKEVFEAWSLPEYYREESGVGVCFELKQGVDKNSIKSLQDLIGNLEKHTDVDCAIRTDKGLRLFQLKDFHKMEKLDPTTQGLIDFIEKSLAKYGGKATKNLLVTLQKADKTDGKEPDFHRVHDYFKDKDLGENEVLVQYNDNNSEMCIISVYPKLASKRIPINWREPDMIKKHGDYVDSDE